MFESSYQKRTVGSLALLVAVLCGPGWAARRVEPASPAEPPARVAVFAAGVQWEPTREIAGATLIVRGPGGETIRRAFKSGAALWFGLEDLGPAPVDGPYLWELRLVPVLTPALREALRAAAESGETSRTEELNRIHRISQAHLLQSGQFHIRAGSIEADEDDLANQDGIPMRAVASPGNSAPLAAFDVSGDWTMTGNLGVGTDTPSQGLDIVSFSPTIQMEDSSDSSSWFINGNDSSFDLRRGGNTTSDRMLYLHPSAPKPSLWVNSLGNWGNGTAVPLAPIHVQRIDGTAKILVDDNSPTVARRTLFELENNGGIAFRFLNTATGANWFFSQDSNDSFAISLSGTGGPEFLVRTNGRVQMGPGGASTFDLMPSGNLTIGGVLTELSDRDAKENFMAVDAGRILDKVVALPLTTWNLRADPAAARHLGPTAQDFRAAFGLGSDPRHISEVDRSGVALAAIQGLHQQLRERDAELSVLREEIEALKARVKLLEALATTVAQLKTQTADPTVAADSANR